MEGGAGGLRVGLSEGLKKVGPRPRAEKVMFRLLFMFLWWFRLLNGVVCLIYL